MRDPLVLIDQEVFHGHLQEPGQGQQVIHRGQALAVLPLVNGLRVLKPEIGLEVPHGQPGVAAVPLNAAARLRQVDDRKRGLHVHRTILSFGCLPLFHSEAAGRATAAPVRSSFPLDACRFPNRESAGHATAAPVRSSFPLDACSSIQK